MQKNKKESLILGKLLKKIAPSIGARVILEPEWGIAGQITFKNGRRSYFRYNTLDLNPVGSSDIAKDKDYATWFMRNMGYPVVPESKTFFSDSWAKALNINNRGLKEAYRYAQKLGWPVIVKPNSGSQGSGVALVHNKREFYQATRMVFKKDRVALIQKFLLGKDYRLVVLDKEVISAYERIPLSVIGNGRSSIKQLLETKQRLFRVAKRDTQIRMDDPRIKMKLARAGMSLRSVPAKGQQIYLLDNANLSTGGDSIDVTQAVHPDFKRLAMRVAKDMNLRLAGVDIIVDGDIAAKPGRYWILEINAAPGLDHYARMGKAQEKIVEQLYRKVLKGLAR